MPLGPTEARVYMCVDPMNYAPTGCEPFKTAAHVKAMGLAGDLHLQFQVKCPTCGSTSVRPWPPVGADAP
jgi:hypothetical protein